MITPSGDTRVRRTRCRAIRQQRGRDLALRTMVFGPDRRAASRALTSSGAYVLAVGSALPLLAEHDVDTVTIRLPMGSAELRIARA